MANCYECGNEIEVESGLCVDCKEFQDFLSQFSEEEVDEMEKNVRIWVENGCPIPAEITSNGESSEDIPY